MGLHGIELLSRKLSALPPEEKNLDKIKYSEICTEKHRAYMAAAYLKSCGYKKGDIVTLDVIQHAFDLRDGGKLDFMIGNNSLEYLVLKRISDDKFEITDFDVDKISGKSTLKYNPEYVRSLEKKLREKLNGVTDFTSVDVRQLMNVTKNVAADIISYLIKKGLAENVPSSGKSKLYRLKNSQ